MTKIIAYILVYKARWMNNQSSSYLFKKRRLDFIPQIPDFENVLLLHIKDKTLAQQFFKICKSLWKLPFDIGSNMKRLIKSKNNFDSYVPLFREWSSWNSPAPSEMWEEVDLYLFAPPLCRSFTWSTRQTFNLKGWQKLYSFLNCRGK